MRRATVGLFFVILLVFASNVAFSQNVSRTSGRVVDSTGFGIAGAVIECSLPDSTSLSVTTSDSQGNFNMLISNDSCSLRISSSVSGGCDGFGVWGLG